MKELSIEEKAKRYDKFLEELKSKFKDFQVIIYNKNDLEKFFPELAESKDEKIRNWLISTLKSLNSTAIQIDGAYEMMLPAIAWLEKQGEH